MKTLQPLTPINKTLLDDFAVCFKPVKKTYSRGEVIMRLDDDNKSVGILISGTAHLITTTFDGTKTIIDYFEQGGIFGRRFSPGTQTDPYTVIAKNRCTVWLVDYLKVITPCEKRCDKHIRLIDTMLLTMAQRAQLHVEVLGKRTIRGKLLSYFYYLSKARSARTFTLPLSLSDLADYISADRSAMMRELKKLNEEKILISHACKITILKIIPL
ncbi:MAG: Crp/Fnr family transcriptional regulator [Ruminococcus sp.]|nr:Crp/Fnr family transcriptional regulator [Ruminococcus sp.]